MPWARVVSACCRPKASYGVAPNGPAASRSPALGDGGRRVGRIGPSVGIAKGAAASGGVSQPASRPEPAAGSPRTPRAGTTRCRNRWVLRRSTQSRWGRSPREHCVNQRTLDECLDRLDPTRGRPGRC